MAQHKLERKTDSNLVDLIHQLKKKSLDEKVNVWKAVAEHLSSPTSRRRIVNLFKISKSLQKDETIIVPGKVLGAGTMDKKATVAAFSFSKQAVDKINKEGKAISITELMQQNPKAEKVRIIG
jgi:large subunit ribosomal protein L18e